MHVGYKKENIYIREDMKRMKRRKKKGC